MLDKCPRCGGQIDIDEIWDRETCTEDVFYICEDCGYTAPFEYSIEIL